MARRAEPAAEEVLRQDGAWSPMLARLLAARDIRSPDDARRYLDPSPADLIDPLLLPDVGVAVDRIRAAMTGGERLMLFGDYDVDGISAVSIYRELCRCLGLDAVVRIPRRLSEGYGLSRTAVQEAKAAGVSLLITADCGTTAFEEIASARHAGIDVIVTDHHQVPHELPAAVATINPWRNDSRYPFRGLCSSGLAWKVAAAVALQPWGREVRSSLASWTDLAALGTIADVMPLRDENRYLVVNGLSLLSQGQRTGVRALKRVAGVDGKPVGVGTVGFVLGPRLNAAGRLGDAAMGVELLTTSDESEAARLALQHQRDNEARRAIEEGVLREALTQAGRYDLRSATAMVVADRGWHPGVIGIVAARMVERYYRPSIVIAVDPVTGVGKGSGRTIQGIDLYQALGDCTEHLLQFGGHRMAAGLTLRADRVDAFRAVFSEAVARQASPETFEPTLAVDAEVTLGECTWTLLEEINRMAPFGPGNPEPVLVVRGASLVDVRQVGNGHLRLMLRSATGSAAAPPTPATVPAIAFGQGHRVQEAMAGAGRIDVAFMLREDRWRSAGGSAAGGERRLQLQVKDFQSAVSPVDRVAVPVIGAAPA
ncbi:MAG TPA: single-stranded-DNA-specific exonuclease RecJ [Nitrospiria bacterium]|nr:single-stranded-DNA-specific exonuclease RecJ [Nitrospiria bacterium]